MKRLAVLLFVSAFLSFSFTSGFGTKVQIQNELDSIKKKFQENNHRFLFNVFKGKEATVQVIHGEMLPSGGKDFSMYCYLTFDPAMDLDDEHNRFKRSNHLSKFTFMDWDGVPCYYKNIGLNTEESSELILDLLEDVYLVQIFDKLSFETTDEGAIYGKSKRRK